jgi:hypothetical protein
MHFRTSSTFALLAAALTLGAAAEASAQVIPRGGKEPAPCVCDTVRITRVDTVTVWRRDTVRVTQYDTVRVEPLPIVVPPLVGGPYVGLGGGVQFPDGDFGNYEMGWNATGMFGYDFRSNPFGWRVDVAYDQLAESDETAALAPDITLWNVNGDLKFRIPFGETRRSHLYALGGVTWAYYKDAVVGPEVSGPVAPGGEAAAGLDVSSIDNWTSKFGWNAGGGISFGLGRRTNLFIESRYINAEGSWIPVIGGLTWTLGS